MFIKFLKLALIVLFYQTSLYSKSKTLNEFNSQYLSNYFSGIVAYNNKDNSQALKFFKSSKILIKSHNSYLEKYINSLVLEGKITKATNEIRQNLTVNNSNFFEAYLILTLDSIKKGDFKKSKKYLNRSYEFINNDRIALIVAETLKQYLFVFEEKKIPSVKKNFGNFSFVNEVFQRCYLDDKNTKNYFDRLINNDGADYSRYTFFYINYLLENNEHENAKTIANNLDYLNSSLLISQGKKWIENKKFKEFKKIFSCKNSSDVVSEFLFLVANLYSSEQKYQISNFYLNISHYLNPKFHFNLSLLAENYYRNENYSKTLKILNSFNKKDDFYYWFKLKKKAQIITKQKNANAAIDFINLEFKNIKAPTVKTIFDMANFSKNAKRFKESIYYYDQIISKIDVGSYFYSEILYRRGGSYERLGDYKNSDKDLLKALEINPDDAYVLNYLAYSWLERNYKIDEAILMLDRAYKLKKNDPFILDSVGWGYFLINDFVNAEVFLKLAIQYMPDDPTVNDHYGDVLWKLNRKTEAKYYWHSVLSFDDTTDDIKKNVKIKLLKGLEKI